MKASHYKASFVLIFVLLTSFTLSAQKKKDFDLKQLLKDKKVKIHNRNATATDKGIHLDAKGGDGVVWLDNINFSEGEIELDLKGQDIQGQSFVGIAFHGSNDSTFDCVYLRPFNFRAADPVRKSHSIQYISSPAFGWEKLRTEFPGKYENSIGPNPDPNEWVHIKIVVNKDVVTAFVNNNNKPSLTVNKLTKQNKGSVGLWVGNGSAGDFSNMKISNK